MADLRVVCRLTEISGLLEEFFRVSPWTPRTKPEAKKWFQANVSKDLLEWHQAWNEVEPWLHKTPSGKFMWNYDELAQ